MPATIGRRAAVLAATAILVTACTGGAETTTGHTPLRPFNDMDVAFAQHIVAVDEPALAVATMALSHAHDPAVRRLAGEIVTEQAGDVETLADWLHTWLRPAATASPDPLPRLSTTAPQPPTPVATADVDPTQIRLLRGPDFDQAFLAMMLAHHQRTIDIAEAVRADGMNPQVKEVAEALHASRTARLSRLRSLLAAPTPTPD